VVGLGFNEQQTAPTLDGAGGGDIEVGRSPLSAYAAEPPLAESAGQGGVYQAMRIVQLRLFGLRESLWC
jgi:hypothetical protein